MFRELVHQEKHLPVGDVLGAASFNTLPLEIRCMIWHLVIHEPRNLAIGYRHFDRSSVGTYPLSYFYNQVDGKRPTKSAHSTLALALPHDVLESKMWVLQHHVQIPTVLHICQESRAVALRTVSPVFSRAFCIRGKVLTQAARIYIDLSSTPLSQLEIQDALLISSKLSGSWLYQLLNSANRRSYPFSPDT